MADLSVNAFAKRVGYAQSSIDSWLKDRMPAHKFLWDLAKEYGVSFAWLTEGKLPKYLPREGMTSEEVAEEMALYETLKRSGDWAVELAEKLGEDAKLREAAKRLFELSKSNPDSLEALLGIMEALEKKEEGEG